MSNLIASGSLKDFFKSLVDEVSQRRHLGLSEVTQFYLVSLLSDFAEADRLFATDEAGHTVEEPLAFLYKRTLTDDREVKVKTLRRLGDVSLYTAGFFSESLKHRAVGADYYIDMGGAAYGQLSHLAAMSAFAQVYGELHEKFRPVVEVLEEIAARGMCASGPVGSLRVFETWTRTKDAHLEHVLVEVGMVPKGPRN